MARDHEKVMRFNPQNAVPMEPRRTAVYNVNSGATMSKKTLAALVPAVAVALGLSLTACQDTKAREENEQLKAHILQLQKDSGDLGNRVDVLTKENAELKDEVERLKRKHPVKKTPKPKAHRHTSKSAASSQN
jgi:hypothetical protein